MSGQTPRAALQAELAQLEAMLPVWREKLRHPAQFWPQFDALCARILDRASAADAAFVLQDIERMLAQEGLARPRAGDTQPPGKLGR